MYGCLPLSFSAPFVRANFSIQYLYLDISYIKSFMALWTELIFNANSNAKLKIIWKKEREKKVFCCYILSCCALRKILSSVSYLFSQFLRAGTLCWEKIVQVRGTRPKICHLYGPFLCLREVEKQEMNARKNYITNLENYSIFFLFLWRKIYHCVKKSFPHMWGK